jgi:DnaJ-class molecular chaperone
MKLLVTCPTCHGQGKISTPCSICRGAGAIETERTIAVRIPKGSDDGSVLTVKGQGAPGPRGGEPGDLLIETRVRPHPYFRREGLDLYLKLPVTIDEAYNGATVDVPAPGGAVRLKIPSRSQTGNTLRLKGKGVERKKQRGDLYVELSVRLPDLADEDFARAARDAASAYQANLRGELSL